MTDQRSSRAVMPATTAPGRTSPPKISAGTTNPAPATVPSVAAIAATAFVSGLSRW